MERTVWEGLALTEDRINLALETAIDAVKEGVWDLDLCNGSIHLSLACFNLLGLDAGKLPVGHEAWLALLHPDDRQTIANIFLSCAAGEKDSIDIEARLINKENPHIIRIRARVVSVDGLNGHGTHMLGTITDVTKHRKIEEELRESEHRLIESEAKYELLFQSSPDALFIEALDGQILDWNDAACKMYGYSDEEFSRLNTRDLLPIDAAEKISRQFSETKEFGSLVERSENVRKNGEIFPVEIYAKLVKIQGDERVIVNVRDITHQEQAQVNLKRQLRFNEALLNALPNPVFFKDTEGRFLGCNPAFTEQSGVTDAEIRGKTIHDLWPGELADVYHLKDIELMRNKGHQRYESQLIRKDGSLREVIYEKDVFYDEQGAPAGLIGSYVDITERKRAEKIQAAIYRISESVQTVADLDELYREIHHVIGRLMEARNFYIALYDEDTQLLSFPYHVDEIDPPPPPIKIDHGLTAYVLRTGKPLLASPDVFQDLLENGEVDFIGADSLDWLGTPLKTLDKTIGVMAVQTYTPEVRYTSTDMDVLGFVSTQVALAIERKRADEEIRSLNRTLQTISQVNQVLVRAVNEEELEQKVCRILVEGSGYPLAWIGLIKADPTTGELDEDDLSVKMQVMNGQDYGFLSRLTDNSKDGLILCEMTAEALLKCQPLIINDLPGSYPDSLCTKMAEACGYVTAMVLPLIHDHHRVGAVHVYSSQPNAFHPDEVNLLTQMSDDLAFGITTLRTRVRHRIAEEELHQRETQLRDSEEKYRSVVERANDGIAIIKNFRVMFANQRLSEMWGGTPEEVTGRKFSDFISPQSLEQIMTIYRKRRAGEPVPTTYRTKVRTKDGRDIDVELNAGEFNYQGQIAELAIIRDITERKQVEEERAQRLAELEAVNRISSALRTAKSLDEMIARLMDETLAVLNTSAGAIWLYDPDNDQLRALVARGWFSGLSLQPKAPHEGIGGIVFSTGKAYYTRDFAGDPQSRMAIRSQIPQGWGGACIPIYTTTERVGIFYLGVPSERELTEEEKHLLSNLAEIAGNAIYRMRLHAQSELHVQRLNALHNFDLAISSSLDLRLTMDYLLAQVTSQLGVDAADVLLLNEYNQVLEYAAGRGLRGSAGKRARLRLGEGFAGKAAYEHKMVTVPDLTRITLSLSQGLLWQGEDFHTYYAVPLIAKGKIEGVLEVFHRSPLSPDVEWVEFLETLADRAAIAIMVSQLFESLQRTNAELRHAYDTTIEGWSRALELRDRETKDHVMRVVEMTLELAREMRAFNEEELVNLRRGALLHDIGKMGVPDSILRKPGKLTEEEWVEMRRHPQYALEMLSPIPYLNKALDIPYGHHERWDGTGYPQGLKGEQIPLAARIFAAIDVWDALTNDRVYSKAWEAEKVIAYILENSGKQFDPKVVSAFMACYETGRISVWRP